MCVCAPRPAAATVVVCLPLRRRYLNCIKAAYSSLCASPTGQLVAITSLSGEMGLAYRSAYCASKFATTGLLEALRSEMRVLARARAGSGKNRFDITIVCPPTVATNLRANALSAADLKTEQGHYAMTVEECAATIIDAADRRLRKAVFPWKAWAAFYLRPVLPHIIDRLVDTRAKL